MKLCALASLSLLAIVRTASAAAPDPRAPSYSRDVRPFLVRYCLECHNATRAKGGLDLETYAGLYKGGRHGAVLVPGNPDGSRIVRQVEGQSKPVMPPKTARQPRRDEIALLRAWVNAGARDDSTATAVTLPEIKPRGPAPGPVAALAYRPDGKALAAGGYGVAYLIDVASGDVLSELTGQTRLVSALASSRDGRALAVASGDAGRSGELRLYVAGADGGIPARPAWAVSAHRDRIHDLVFSPDGKVLATCGYDRLVRLWDVAAGKEVRTLKDHSDAVYGVAHSPDGRLLASAAADRAVKVWEVATGKRLYSLGESTDWLYAVAWHPGGRYLAAAGVDRSIRVWEVGTGGGRLVHSVFAHNGPVIRLAYSADGATLYSLSEDRTAKAWDAARMEERKSYASHPDAPLALAVRPDGRQIAIGRYDGAAVLVDAQSGQTQSQPLPVKPRPPEVMRVTPKFGRRGAPVRLEIEGKHLDTLERVTASAPGFTARVFHQEKAPTRRVVEVTFAPTTPPGVYNLIFHSVAGPGKELPFTVDPFPVVQEHEPNDSPSTGQKIPIPATLPGAIGKPGDVDYYRFDAHAGQEIGVQALTHAVGSKLDPVLELIDPAGRVLATSENGRLGAVCPQAGVYSLGVRDRDYRGSPDMHYRLHVGDLPIITAVYPLGLQRGTDAEVHLEGVGLGPTRSVRVRAPATAALDSKRAVPLASPNGVPAGDAQVVVGEFPEVVRPETAEPASDLHTPAVPVPGTANGRLRRPGESHVWRFAAHKGRRLVVEVHARRLGSPLDSYIEILDAQGDPLPRALLRSVAKTYVAFRDHDSAGSGIRLEAWNELAVNDYLLVGTELCRIRELPKNPDDDCQFFSERGQRQGFLDTTPAFHSMGTPMYKVSIHPPGTAFPPNGLPVVTIYHRNDDGGPGYGKDSRLFFDPPAEADYQVRITDATGRGGPNYAYRLTVRPPRPDFRISLSPAAPAVWRGGAVPVQIAAERLDGFDGRIDVRLTNLPPGFKAPPTTIPEEETSTALALGAEPDAKVPAGHNALKLVGTAAVDGRTVVRETTGDVPRLLDQPDIVTRTDQPEVAVRPGGQVVLTARIERRNGFKGRVPLDVRGLPHGVRVLDIGLNGILITEHATERAFVIYAEPWVKPTVQPFVVLARHEGKNAEFAAPPVRLRISGR